MISTSSTFLMSSNSIRTGVNRDGLKESLVISKTFQVDEAGLPTDTLDDGDCLDGSRSENDFKPIISKLGPKSAAGQSIHRKVFIYFLWLQWSFNVKY